MKSSCLHIPSSQQMYGICNMKTHKNSLGKKTVKQHSHGRERSMSCGFFSHVSGPDAAWGYVWPAHPSVACDSTSFATPGTFDDEKHPGRVVSGKIPHTNQWWWNAWFLTYFNHSTAPQKFILLMLLRITFSGSSFGAALITYRHEGKPLNYYNAIPVDGLYDISCRIHP